MLSNGSANNIQVLLAGLISVLLLTACSENKAPEALSTEEQLLRLGNEKARMCVGCHGPKGISLVVSYPSLAGKSQEYLTEQLQAFRSGERVNPMMSSIARNITEDDIAALSFYYASLPGPVVETDNPVSGPQEL